MRRAIVAVAFAAVLAGSTAQAGALSIEPTRVAAKVSCSYVTAKDFRGFSQRVWKLKRWKRGAPKKSTIQAKNWKLRCARGPGHRQAMKKRWRKDRRAYLKHRQEKLAYKRKWGDCSHEGPVTDCIHGAALTHGADEGWMLGVSHCESTWDRHAYNPSGATGLFQFMPGTWASTPYGHLDIYSVKWQSLGAAWMYVNGRSGEWVCQA